jgi:hypothetical protein
MLDQDQLNEWFVTLLEYVPEPLHRVYLNRLYSLVLARGGLLIVSNHGSQNLHLPPLDITDYLGTLGYDVKGQAASQETKGWTATRTAWISKQAQ